MTAPEQGGGGRLTALAHNRTAQIAAVGAAGVAAYVLYRKSAGGGSSTSGGSSGGATPGNPASLDTTGSDIAVQLGQFEAAQQQALDEFAKTLQQTLGGLKPPTTTTGGTGGGTTPPIAKPPPQTTTKPPPTKVTTKYVKVTKYPSAYGTLSGIAKGEHTTVTAILKLNPGIHNANLIYPGQSIRVK